MSASEFAFLALGLMLGVASGAALVVVLRARPLPPREIVVTVAPDSVPRRPSTLAVDPFEPVQPGPARGGPADRREVDRPAGMAGFGLVPALAVAGAPRTDVPFAVERRPVAIDIAHHGRVDPVVAAIGRTTSGAASAGEWVDDPRETAPTVAVAEPAMSGPAAVGADTVVTGVALATAGRPVASSNPWAAGGGQPAGPTDPGSTDPCAALVAVAEDRCSVAERARSAAETAAEVLHDVRRAYDEHLARAEDAERRSDPRAIRVAKEEAHARFRSARDSAPDRDALDAAASAWLGEVNRINAEAREASARVGRERAAADGIAAALERRSAEADAARIAAESAAEACLGARQALADCREAVVRREAEVPAAVPPLGPVYPEERPELEPPDLTGGSPRILRLLRGDDQAMSEIVAALAGDDPAGQREWQLSISALADAIAATAIDASHLDLPESHAFWGLFDPVERREIAGALASLGFRFDGLGGFVDGRVPSQRDLSLAVGYAGQDPMRIRIWPTEAEMPLLFQDARVAADDFLIEAAGDLTLGEMVDLLGRRAEGLTGVWNDWGRIRPALLATR